ncbi:MAG: hypothetical protein RIS92_699, partial [Verrucomicrobiota bacterium]|jgi:hypothetical protein
MQTSRSLLLVALASCTTLLLGSLGFHDLDPDQGWFTSLYKSAQLFSMGSGVVEEKNTPLFIEISRWLAVAAVIGGVYATLTSLMSDFRERRRLASLNGHAIVCGVGNRGSEIARAFTSEKSSNRQVVVIELDEHNPALGELRNLAETEGITLSIVNGNALDESVLERAGVRRARTLVAVTGNDEKNLSICAEAEKMNKGCTLSAGIESWAWRSFYLDRLRSQIRLDSYLSRAARNLTLTLACDAIRSANLRSNGVRLLIEASPNTRQELIRAAALNLQIAGDKRPTLELTNATQEEEDSFNDRFPATSLVVDLHWHRSSASRTFPEHAPSFPDFAIFALDDDIETLEAAERCWMRSTIPSHRVRACVQSESNSIEMPAIQRRSDDFVIENIFKLGLGSSDPTEIDIENRAKICHAIYFKNEKEKNEKEKKHAYGTAPGDLPEDWNQLSERVRESNRLLAMHHEVKRVAWEHREGTPDVELLKHLSRCEHMRWMAEKVMDGWRWSGSTDKSSRDNLRLKHHLLVHFDALENPEKDKDFNAFLWALAIPDEQLQGLDLSEDIKRLAREDHRLSTRFSASSPSTPKTITSS